VEELLTTRRAFMLASFAKTSLWVVGVTLLVVWILPADFVQISGWKLSLLTIGGGVLFGVGATVNRGCAFSTLTRFGGGNVGMVASLAGFLVGAGAYGVITAAGLTSAMVETPAALSMEGLWRLPVTVAVASWMAWELVRLSRSARPGNWCQRLLAPHYRLSTAAVLMGFSGAMLYALIGVWPYTRLFGQTASYAVIGAPPPLATLWLLFVALIGGIGLSAWQGRRFRWQWRPQRRWVRYGTGGVLMGSGAAMIPGGNDVLILHGIPSLSPHAVPAFLAMLVGIAVSLMIMHVLGHEIPRINCGGDICTTESD
ncbi:MAG: YeeE/YedE thiosulfate transporter family protein, partial [Hyphomicrobium sp.]